MTQALGIKLTSGSKKEPIVVYVNRETREVIEKVYITATNNEHEYMACTESGETFGYRHDSARRALEKVESDLGVQVTYVDEAHPAVRQYLQAV